MIVVSGEALIDMTPSGCGAERGYIPRLGGSPYNVAVALGRLEVPVAFLGRLSRDFFGQRLRAHLVSNGVNGCYLRDGHEPSTLAFVSLNDGFDAEYAFWTENSADRNVMPSDLPPVLDDDVVALHFGSLSLVLEPIATTLQLLVQRELGKRVIVVDPNVRPLLIQDIDAYRTRLENWVRRADVVKASRADMAWLYPNDPVERSARNWLELGPSLVIVTLGSEGSVGFIRAETVEVPGSPVTVVDTVGAGDAFSAAMLAWLHYQGCLNRDLLPELSSQRLAQLLRFANLASARTCARAGAEAPYRYELPALQ
ncbi:MAG: carbohydrate kinase [Chloroflexi bacterium]|nr:MAG: carbohydrate kinase [Chloroflexota bacterium]